MKKLCLLFLINSINLYAQEIDGNYIKFNNKKYLISDIKIKCATPKFENNKICNKLFDAKKDPIIDNLKLKPVKWETNASFSMVGQIKGFEFKEYYLWSHWGIGVYYKKNSVSGFTSADENVLRGANKGISLKYMILDNYVYQGNANLFQTSILFNGGISNYYSDVQEQLPTYPTMEFGVEFSKKVSNKIPVDGFIKIETTEIYHSSSGVLNLGSSAAVGLKISF